MQLLLLKLFYFQDDDAFYGFGPDELAISQDKANQQKALIADSLHIPEEERFAAVDVKKLLAAASMASIAPSLQSEQPPVTNTLDNKEGKEKEIDKPPEIKKGKVKETPKKVSFDLLCCKI